METINLQNKTKALNGNIEAYWFENKNFDLEKLSFTELPFHSNHLLQTWNMRGSRKKQRSYSTGSE